MNTSWADLNRDGRRLEKIIKMCDSYIQTESKREDPDIGRIWGYIDRLEKLTHRKESITETVLGVKKLRKIAERAYA